LRTRSRSPSTPSEPDDTGRADSGQGRADLRPAPGAIIRDLELRRPIYRQIAAYGHFGRPDLDLPWERTDKAEALRADGRSD
jgi:hypothetical protein